MADGSFCREDDPSPLREPIYTLHMIEPDRWPALAKDDEALLEELQSILTERVKGDPYREDGGFAAGIAALPVGLRAMAATHWLDISLTLDSITWHFGNFGEPGLVAETEAGLRELGLCDLAAVFCDARDLMVPLFKERGPDEDPDDLYARKGVQQQVEALDDRAWALDNLRGTRSVIYEAWVRYTRQHPDRVFAA